MRKNNKSTKNKSIINNKLKSKVKKIKFKIHKSKKIKKIIAPAHVESIAKKPRKQRKLTSPTSPLRYFTNDTEQAIIEYNSTDDQNIKNELYITRIHQPFTKLVECIFNTFKFINLIQNEGARSIRTDLRRRIHIFLSSPSIF
jgi:hypothetical protein